MAMRFHIAICVVTPLELLTLLAVHFAVGLTTNNKYRISENSQSFFKIKNKCLENIFFGITQYCWHDVVV